jgi:formylglycine-generating enzyme required for sulfatase activity
MKHIVVAIGAVIALSGFAGELRAVTLNLLPVGDPGNAVDPRPGAHLGAVAYRYYLDKYDVTNAQYVEFLNVKASAADPYALYDVQMAEEHTQGGIIRSANAPFVYSVKANMENKPVVNVSWFDAIRFTNWLTNGQGNGDTESGTYLITNGGPNSGSAVVPTAAERAAWIGQSLHYMLPSADEWYKAAYYKGGNTNAGFWNYPLSSNTQPISGPPGQPLRANVIDLSGNFAVPGPIYLTDVGAYPSKSPYGHSDMAGNVYQFTDSFSELDPSKVVLRGDPFSGSADGAFFQNSKSSFGPGLPYSEIGFRIAMVPEPGTLTQVAVVGLFASLAMLRKRLLRRTA